MTTAAATSTPPACAGPGEVAVVVPRSVLAGLLAAAEHTKTCLDWAAGTSTERQVRWVCTADCPVCAASALLEGHTP